MFQPCSNSNQLSVGTIFLSICLELKTQVVIPTKQETNKHCWSFLPGTEIFIFWLFHGRNSEVIKWPNNHPRIVSVCRVNTSNSPYINNTNICNYKLTSLSSFSYAIKSIFTSDLSLAMISPNSVTCFSCPRELQ